MLQRAAISLVGLDRGPEMTPTAALHPLDLPSQLIGCG